MDLSRGYAINAPDVVAENFSGETVILNLANGHYFSLQGIASPIWALLLAGHAPNDILDSIEKSRQDMVAESSRFIGRLLELNLIVPQAGAEGPSGPIDTSWDGTSPHIDIFDDLAELIFADPIHDVDEQAGWPTPRKTP